MSTKSTVNIDLTLPFALFLVFLILKLAGAIAWSWWWVFAPLWIPVAIIVLLFVLASLFVLFGE